MAGAVGGAVGGAASVVQLPFIIRTVVFEQAYKNVFFFFGGIWVASYWTVSLPSKITNGKKVGIEVNTTVRNFKGKTRKDQALTTCCSPCFCRCLLVVICHNLVALPCNIVAGHNTEVVTKTGALKNVSFAIYYKKDINFGIQNQFRMLDTMMRSSCGQASLIFEHIEYWDNESWFLPVQNYNKLIKNRQLQQTEFIAR